jgi:hypothetical protein
MNLRGTTDVAVNAGGQFFQSVGIVSDSTSLDDFSLHIHYYEIMLVSRPIETNNNHSEILSILSYNKVTDESFVSGIPMKALSLPTGDSVSAVCECQDVASCPFRPSKGRKSRALPHPGPLALQPLRSGCKASTNLMAKNYTNIKREHWEQANEK